MHYKYVGTVMYYLLVLINYSWFTIFEVIVMLRTDIVITNTTYNNILNPVHKIYVDFNHLK